MIFNLAQKEKKTFQMIKLHIYSLNISQKKKDLLKNQMTLLSLTYLLFAHHSFRIVHTGGKTSIFAKDFCKKNI